MMKRTHPIAILLAFALPGCAGGKNASYGLGYSVQNGAALLPPTASRGTTTTLNYHESGGALARAIILIVSAMGLKNPNGDFYSSSTSETHDEGDYRVTTTTTTTTFVPTTSEERAAREAAIQDFSQNVAPGIIHGNMPVELDIGITGTGYGLDSDTTGGSFDMLFNITPTRTTGIAVGFGIQSYTFHDRTISDVVDDGSTLTTTKRMGDLGYTFVGVPLRITHSVANRTSVFLQWDANLYSLLEDAPSPFTLGVFLKFPVLSLKGTVISDRFDPSATTFGLEAILGF